MTPSSLPESHECSQSKLIDELFRVSFDKFDKVKAAKETTTPALLSHNGGLLQKSLSYDGTLFHKAGIRAWEPRPRADGDVNEQWPIRRTKVPRIDVGSISAEKLQIQEVQGNSHNAKPSTTGLQRQLRQENQLQPDQQNAGTFGIRNRKSQEGVRLLELPQEAFEGRRRLESYVNEVSRQQTAGGESSRSPSSSVRISRKLPFLGKSLNWILNIPFSSKVYTLLVRALFPTLKCSSSDHIPFTFWGLAFHSLLCLLFVTVIC